MKTSKTLLLTSSLISALALTGCGDTTNDSGSGTGQLSVNVTDAPVHEADNVMIKFSGMEIKPAEGDRIEILFDEPKTIDLLALQGSSSAPLLSSEDVDAGTYNWIRLMVDTAPNATDPLTTSHIVVGGNPEALDIPSGNQTGLKLNTPFTVPEDGALGITIDFDLSKSVIQSNNGYKLKPTLRLVIDDQIAHISGSLAFDTVINTAECNPGNGYAVYLYEGHDVVADDIDGTPADPIVTSLTTTDTSTSNENYELGFVPAGNYTIAYTCDAASDTADVSEDIIFAGNANLTVTAGQNLTHNFE